VEIFDYEHEQLSAAEMKAGIDQLISTASEEERRLVHRILRAVLK